MNKKRIIAGLVLIPTALCLAIGIPKIEDYVRKRLNARHEERVEKLEKLIKWTEKIPAIEGKGYFYYALRDYKENYCVNHMVQNSEIDLNDINNIYLKLNKGKQPQKDSFIERPVYNCEQGLC